MVHAPVVAANTPGSTISVGKTVLIARLLRMIGFANQKTASVCAFL